MLDAVLADVHWHMLAVFIVWSVIFVTALVRFRAGRQAEPRASGPRLRWPAVAIGAVIAGDVILVAGRALPAWNARLASPAPGVPTLDVRVEADQFSWNIHYPGPDGRFGRTGAAFISSSNPVGIDRADPLAADDIGLQNLLVLPIDRTIVVDLTSRDVIHSFTLPEMRVKQDATPGMTVRTWFTPAKLGAWEIVCSQLCGLGHYRMRGDYRVVSRDEWDQWQAEEIARLR